jgi:hypothetical protein
MKLEFFAHLKYLCPVVISYMNMNLCLLSRFEILRRLKCHYCTCISLSVRPSVRFSVYLYGFMIAFLLSAPFACHFWHTHMVKYSEEVCSLNALTSQSQEKLFFYHFSLKESLH